MDIGHAVESKGAATPQTLQHLMTGEDWSGRRYASTRELVKEFKLTHWGPQDATIYEYFPAFVISSVIGLSPVPLSNLLSWISGQQTFMDSMLKSAGLTISRGQVEGPAMSEWERKS